MEQPYLLYEEGRIGPRSNLMKLAAEKNNALLRAREVSDHREAQRKLADLRVVKKSILVEPEVVGGVGCEWVSAPEHDLDRVIVYLHGGSWTFGDLKTSRPTAALLAEISGFSVLSVEYRLSPEHPYPAALEDCNSVYGELLRQGYLPGNLGLFGDSAGGNLALALTHMLKEKGEPLPAAIACASPVTDLREEGTMVLKAPDYLFTQYQGLEWDMLTLYLGDHDRVLPTVSPVMGDLEGFPPILIHTGEDEALLKDNILFAERAHQQGVKVACKVWKGMFHDFSIGGNALKESRYSLRELVGHLGQYMKEVEE